MSKQPQFMIEELRPEDVGAITSLRYESHLDTYVNEELGVTREWLQERNKRYQTTEHIHAWREVSQAGRANGMSAAWVARSVDGTIVGFATPFIQPDGTRRVGSIYVAKTWQGKGVGNALMQRVIDWHGTSEPITIHVVAYNERAKAFYRKWGFVEVPGSEQLFDNKIPEVKMIREGARQ